MSLSKRLNKISEQLESIRPEPGMCIVANFCRKGTVKTFSGQGGPYHIQEFETEEAFKSRALKGAQDAARWNEIPIIISVKEGSQSGS